MLAITDVSDYCQQKFWFLYSLFASSKVVKVLVSLTQAHDTNSPNHSRTNV